MKKLIRDRNGFTLIELMVVVAIIAVLATMVMGGVTGTGTSGEKAQVVNDASTMKTGVISYNNAAIDQSWPVSAITTDGTNFTFASTGFNFLDSAQMVNKVIPITRFASVPFTASDISSYEFINWKASTNVRQKQGGVAVAKLVPDFVDAPPDSTRLLSGLDAASSSGKLPEYIWVLKVGSALDANARSVQVWHLDDTEGVADADKLYLRIYPKVQ